MKNSVLTLVVGLMLLGGVYLGVYHWRMAEPHRAMASDYPELQWLRHEFQLDDSQFGKIQGMHAAFDVECHQMCENLAESQQRLHRAIGRSDTITEEVRSAMDESARLREYCRGETLKHIYAVSQVMEQKQGRRYRETISRNLMVPGRLPHLDADGKLIDHAAHHNHHQKKGSEAEGPAARPPHE
jgi:hypothetical protein